jgi:hypothetical protein
LLSTCDIAPIASAKALAHTNRFFMIMPFCLIAAIRGGLFGDLTGKAKPLLTDGNSPSLRSICTPTRYSAGTVISCQNAHRLS